MKSEKRKRGARGRGEERERNRDTERDRERGQQASQASPGLRAAWFAGPGTRVPLGPVDGRKGVVDLTSHLLGKAPLAAPSPPAVQALEDLDLPHSPGPHPGTSPSHSHLAGPSWLGTEGNKMALSLYLGLLAALLATAGRAVRICRRVWMRPCLLQTVN